MTETQLTYVLIRKINYLYASPNEHFKSYHSFNDVAKII